MTQTIDDLRRMLETDGFGLDITSEGDHTHAAIVVTSDDACADCIVPESVMRLYLEPALGVQGDALSISYPSEAATADQ